MAKALIINASRTGATTKIGGLIAEGVRFSGHEAEMLDVSQVRKAEDIQGYDAYVFGSATYHGEMLQQMKTMLFLAEKAGLAGKVGGAFGAFGWSGEAPERIFNTMKHVLGMNMVGDCLRLKSADLQGGVQMAQDYGRQVGKKLTA
ncbi:MAG: flavodoxin domain-containing protein [Proteobacteria bacterium]|nr:flavodoxin domain-containing protein [Pseudomonadota bacterium]